MKLIIAEKPSMAREIAKNLQGKVEQANGYLQVGPYCVTWQFGHLLEAFQPEDYDPKYKIWRASDLPIVPDIWERKVSPSCKEQFEVIKKLAADADVIIHAGDPDREGQLLVDETLKFIGNEKPVKRLLLNALDEQSVKKALADLRDNEDFLPLQHCAYTRSVIDWLIGMNLSRAYTLAARSKGHDFTIPIGRVSTPTLAIVVRRENQVQHFIPQKYFTITGHFTDKVGSAFDCIWRAQELQDGLDEAGRLTDPSARDALLKKLEAECGKNTAFVRGCKVEAKKESPRLPYSLSALQIHAGKSFGYDPQQVLDTAQKLYERKLTTYPRSDCDYLPTSQHGDATRILQHLRQSVDAQLREWANLQTLDLSRQSRAWNDSKISAHHAIIPTTVSCDMSKLSDVERNIYTMICAAYINLFLPDYLYEQTKLEISCGDESFTATGKTITQLGWKTLYQTEKEPSAEDEKILPKLAVNMALNLSNITSAEKMTKPPQRFTPATLLGAMKEIHKFVKEAENKALIKSLSGIGTEATRAGIIDNLIKRGFLYQEKKFLKPSEEATLLIKILPDDLTYPDSTARMETDLAALEAGQKTVSSVLDSQIKELGTLCELAKKSVPAAAHTEKCPACGGVLRRKKAKDGFFWGCANYPDCKTTFPDSKGKALVIICPECQKGYLRKLKGKKGNFWSCSRWQDGCSCTFNDKKGKPDISAPKKRRK